MVIFVKEYQVIWFKMKGELDAVKTKGMYLKSLSAASY